MENQNFEDPQRRVKHEPPVEFVLILPRPTTGWPAIKQEKDVKPKRVPLVKLTKFDTKWRSKSKLFQTFFTCPPCHFVIKLQGNLTRHLRTCSTTNQARFECDFCEKTFQKKSRMISHMSKHSSERRFCCTKCGFGFKSKLELLRHSRVKTIYKCAACDIKFSCKLLLDRHQSDFHRNIFKCDECSYQTKRKDVLVQHKGIHDKSFACETCRQKFSLNRQLKVHQMQHRHGIFATASEENFDCDKCGKSFSALTYLRSHQKCVHDDKEVKCKVCGKTCKNYYLLRGHKRIHNKAECSICHKMFSKHLMPFHLRTHSAENHFKCDLCDHSNNSKGNLKTHIEAKHLLKKLLSDSKCREDFSDFELLEKLQMKHGSSATTSEKKFKCDKCGKSFVTTHTLNIHKRTVHTIKQFECEICKKAFKTKCNMNRHKATVHSKKKDRSVSIKI